MVTLKIVSGPFVFGIHRKTASCSEPWWSTSCKSLDADFGMVIFQGKFPSRDIPFAKHTVSLAKTSVCLFSTNSLTNSRTCPPL